MTTNPDGDRCRPVEIDGELIRVHGNGEMSDETRAALADVIGAAKRKYLAEHPQVEPADPERRERYAEALYNTLENSPSRHPWATLSGLRRAVWYDRADAAMALADAELAAVAAPPPATRATVLRDFLWRLEQSAGDAAAEKFLDDNPELRRMADEASGDL